VTTIVYRSGVLAADSLATRGQWKLPGVTAKLFRMKDGGMAGVTGDYAPAVRYAGGAYTEDVSTFCAWGSGMPCALAALHMGASAAKAVSVAAVVDTSTGGNVITMKCEI